MDSYDVAVIGRGMVGAAAARHLAESGLSTVVIGPREPEDRKGSQGPFSSHPDEGRITRVAARTMTWAQLAARSISRYRDIEIRSGISFYVPSGLAVASEVIDDWIDSGLVLGSNIHKVDADWLRQTTGISVTNGLPIAYEGRPAGHINPRRLVEAQSKLADVADATVIDDAVGALEASAGGFEASGSWGSVKAKRVLVATGAFGRDLIEGELSVKRLARTVVQAEMVDPGVIPSLITANPPDPRLSGIYWVPPVRYPDGRLCLKIGGSLIEDRPIDGDEALIDWFHTDGYPAEIEALQTSVQGLLPDTLFTSFTSTPCVITETPTEYPYIGFVSDDRIAVAIGGNGSAAKSSDELGRLAATLFSTDGWDDSVDAEIFTPQLA